MDDTVQFPMLDGATLVAFTVKMANWENCSEKFPNWKYNCFVTTWRSNPGSERLHTQAIKHIQKQLTSPCFSVGFRSHNRRLLGFQVTCTLCKVLLYWELGPIWERTWKRINTCICITESPCCPPETNTTLLINYTPGHKINVKRSWELGSLDLCGVSKVYSLPGSKGSAK